MKIYSVYRRGVAQPASPATCWRVTTPRPLCAAMRSIPMPERGTAYDPSIPVLEECAHCVRARCKIDAYGGMPIQLGLCWGYNTRLNCLEYRRDSEVNVGARDFILLLGKQDEIENGVLDAGRVKAFRAAAGGYGRGEVSRHHAALCALPYKCGGRLLHGRCAAARHQYRQKPSVVQHSGGEDALLWARNKWLLAHAASDEAAQGAYVGLAGENIDISDSL